MGLKKWISILEILDSKKARLGLKILAAAYALFAVFIFAREVIYYSSRNYILSGEGYSHFSLVIAVVLAFGAVKFGQGTSKKKTFYVIATGVVLGALLIDAPFLLYHMGFNPIPTPFFIPTTFTGSAAAMLFAQTYLAWLLGKVATKFKLANMIVLWIFFDLLGRNGIIAGYYFELFRAPKEMFRYWPFFSIFTMSLMLIQIRAAYREIPLTIEVEKDQPTSGPGMSDEEAGSLIFSGSIILGIGLIVTMGSFLLASSSPTGGHYLVTTGIIFVGLQRLIRGIRNRRKN